MTGSLNGYAGRILHVDLTHGTFDLLSPDESALRQYVGGTALGARLLYDSVPSGVAWNDEANRVFLLSGPLAGTTVAGTGTFSVVFKGPMTNVAGASQANGFLGAFIKFAGFDGVSVGGVSPTWVYLYVRDGQAELRDAAHLLGKTTLETETAIASELGLARRQVSVYAIGPAGENQVRFAGLVGDEGHAAAHNGLGAVLGAKRLKAIAVARGTGRATVREPGRVRDLGKALLAASQKAGGVRLTEWGTAGGLENTYRSGMLPVRNYSTNLFPEYVRFTGQYLRTHFPVKPNPCWACALNHVRTIRITEGPYAGFEGEEPEYECCATFGALIGVTDPAATIVLSNMADWLGLDVNECGWVLAWVIECYEKGILEHKDLDGLEPAWGDAETARALLEKIAHREGCGAWLAEGVMRAAQRVGGEAPNIGVYTLKGASPRSHDHRGRWYEMLDTCLSGTSTIEGSNASPPPVPGMPPRTDLFSPQQAAEVNAHYSAWQQFEDCLGICRFCSRDPELAVACVNAVTGWDMTVVEALAVGRRASNLLRLFNLRHGLDPALERPSPRYGSVPVDGPAAGRNILEHWDVMVSRYWELMGWDQTTGAPLPETLRGLGLEMG